jgi:hypothetical protein
MVQNLPQPNPLAAFMRQPKIYISLPSGGEFYPPGCLIPTETGQFPVYSMTAKDELLLNVPDALMNGQAIVDVIQNCMPNIKNAWHVPNIDLDMILLAMRLATYGELMVTPVKVNDDVEFDYQVDLRIVMDALTSQISWDPIVPVNDEMTVYVRPLNYRQMTKTALQTFETQKIIQAVNDEKMSEDDRLQVFKDSFKKLSDVTVGMVADSIYRIDTAMGSTDNPEFIREFIENADKDVFNVIQKHIERYKEQNTIKPIVVDVTEDMRARGVTGDTIEIPLTFDPSTFFA